MRLAFSLTAIAVYLLPAGLVAGPPAEKTKAVDIVICLDTSGSMDGLIDSAKRKLWVVVNDLAKMTPTPELRVGLYSYGNNAYDAKRGWVRLEAPLTTDLDEVYKRINVLKCASPGSDEFVARVTRDALAEMKWAVDKDALRMIFVCGNEPVDQDKEVTLEPVAATAKAKDVIINTIYCGPANHAEVIGWCNFATSTRGRYTNIDQDRAKAEVVIKTPFDEEIQKLGTKINETYLWYGAKGDLGRANQSAQDANAAKTAPGVAVERSLTKAGGLYKNAECDLIDKMRADTKFDLKQLKEEDLPEELKKLKPDERLAYLNKKAKDRAEIQKKVADLSFRRALYLQDERAKQPKSARDKALDEALRSILREEATAKGLKVKD